MVRPKPSNPDYLDGPGGGVAPAVTAFGEAQIDLLWLSSDFDIGGNILSARRRFACASMSRAAVLRTSSPTEMRSAARRAASFIADKTCYGMFGGYGAHWRSSHNDLRPAAMKEPPDDQKANALQTRVGGDFDHQ
jgi:hypothetical protein